MPTVVHAEKLNVVGKPMAVRLRTWLASFWSWWPSEGYSHFFVDTFLYSMALILLLETLGMALFSESLQYSLALQLQACRDRIRVDPTIDASPYVASAIQLQLIKGINATIWNLEQRAHFGIATALQLYNASASCQLDTKVNVNSTGLQSLAQRANASAAYNVSLFVNVSRQALASLANNRIPRLRTTDSVDCCMSHYGKALKFVFEAIDTSLAASGTLAGLFAVLYFLFKIAGARALLHTLPQSTATEERPKRSSHPVIAQDAGDTTSTISNDFSAVSYWPTLSKLWFSGPLLAMLQFSFVLATFSLAVSQITPRMCDGTEEHSCKTPSLADDIREVYSQYEAGLNRHAYEIVSGLIENLNSNQSRLLALLNSQLLRPLKDLSPFASGVAVELVDFPFPSRVHSSIKQNTTQEVGFLKAETRHAQLLALPCRLPKYFGISSLILILCWMAGCGIVAWIFSNKLAKKH